MFTRIKKLGFNKINSILVIAGLEITRRHSSYQNYIPFRKNMEEAKKAGLSIGDYIDLTYNVPGATQDTINQMVGIGVFNRPIERVCEIGPGSGRYLEKTQEICQPKYYEIYETSEEWRKWLVETYAVTAHIPDGRTLSQTRSHSIDLIHSHKVFPGLSILVILQYFLEMIRVVREGGCIVFDILSENCLSDSLVDK